jgi:mannose-6-phosphate isomerase
MIEIEIFPKATDMGERLWGVETLLALVPGKFTLKKLFLRSGSKGGLQYHHLKDEVIVVISGRLIVRIDDGAGVLSEYRLEEGDVAHFYPGLVHQEEAVTDCILIEASTPHFNDRVRVEEKYGLSQESGLPSTSIDDVLER